MSMMPGQSRLRTPNHPAMVPTWLAWLSQTDESRGGSLSVLYVFYSLPSGGHSAEPDRETPPQLPSKKNDFGGEKSNLKMQFSLYCEM